MYIVALIFVPVLYVRLGTSIFGEHGWWSLSSLIPPDPRHIFSGGLPTKKTTPTSSPSPLLVDHAPPPAKRTRLSLVPPLTSDTTQLQTTPTTTTNVSSLQPKLNQNMELSEISSDGGATNGGQDLLSNASVQVPQPEIESVKYVCVTERQEKVLMEHLLRLGKAVKRCPKASRLLRKLKIRAKQRDYGRIPFDLDQIVTDTITHTLKYVIDEKLPYQDQVVPVPQDPQPLLDLDQFDKDEEIASSFNATPMFTTHGNDILDQLSLIPVLSRTLPLDYFKFEHYLSGELSSAPQPFTSPYTARKLKPFIFRTIEIVPLRAKLNSEIINHPLAQHNTNGIASSQNLALKSIDFCYLQEHHVPAVNSLISRFFWPVDLTECLQYPDFTCVVFYGKLLIGCAFMTPDVKVNEAYISFLLVHPDFQRSGIGRIMLYHLIQSCCGKDVTLHVSVDNPAMILYQRFGFKAEKFCLDFYERYYPPQHYLSKHAYFMRLRK